MVHGREGEGEGRKLCKGLAEEHSKEEGEIKSESASIKDGARVYAFLAGAAAFLGAAAFFAAGFLAAAAAAVFLAAGFLAAEVVLLAFLGAAAFLVAVVFLGASDEAPLVAVAFLGAAAFFATATFLALGTAVTDVALGANLTLPEIPLGRAKTCLASPVLIAFAIRLLNVAGLTLLVSGCLALMYFLIVGRPRPARASDGCATMASLIMACGRWATEGRRWCGQTRCSDAPIKEDSLPPIR